MLDTHNMGKMPSKTFFGDLQPLVPRFEGWKGNQKPISTPKSGAMPVVDRLPKYVLWMSQLATISELLADLEKAFRGQELSQNYERPESHDCKLSPDSSCAGCEAIVEALK